MLNRMFANINLKSVALFCATLLTLPSVEVCASVKNVLHVAKWGNDNSDGSANAPFLTIKKAAAIADVGDTICIEGGTYEEENIVAAADLITFMPLSSNDKVIVKHPATEVTSSSIFKLKDVKNVSIKGLYFEDYLYGNAILIIGGEGNIVSDCHFYSIGTAEESPSPGMSMIRIASGSKLNSIVNNSLVDIYGDGVSIDNATNNIVAYNTFNNFHGKKRNWSATSEYSSAIKCDDTTHGRNLFAFNLGENLKNLVWTDRDGSENIVLRNECTDSEILFFNESRCKGNIAQENIALNMTAYAYQSAQYSTGFTLDARWIHNVAYNSRGGFYLHKSKRDEVRGNIAVGNDTDNFTLTDIAKADSCGPRITDYNLWEDTSLFVDADNGDFAIAPSSVARGAGYKGVDLGAYPVCGNSIVGFSEDRQGGEATTVQFDSLISVAPRGESMTISVILSRPAENSITVRISQIAGEAIADEDYVLDGEIITFAKGESKKSVSITLSGKSRYEELLALALSSDDADICGRSLHMIRIKANEEYASDIDGVTIDDNCPKIKKLLTPKGIVIEMRGRSYDVAGKRF